MNTKYLLVIALSLYGTSAHAADNASGNFWARNSDQIFVTLITSVIGGTITTVVTLAIQAYLNPKDPTTSKNLAILERDDTINNTRRQLETLRELASTTKNPSVEQDCHKQIETGEQLLAQAIALRNQNLAKLHTEQPQNASPRTA